jgi:hypothetical protein
MLLAAGGCATGPPQSGFLADYSALKEVPEYAPIWDYVDPEGRRREMKAHIWADRTNWHAAANYERVIIDPVGIQLRPDATGTWVNPERLNELTQYTRDATVNAFKDRYPAVEQPGPGVLRIRAAITDAYPAQRYDAPKSGYHPGFGWANSMPGGATLEAEWVDSVTGERILAAVLTARGSYIDASTDEDPWKRPRRVIDGLARFGRKVMDEAHDAPEQ